MSDETIVAVAAASQVLSEAARKGADRSDRGAGAAWEETHPSPPAPLSPPPLPPAMAARVRSVLPLLGSLFPTGRFVESLCVAPSPDFPVHLVPRRDPGRQPRPRRRGLGPRRLAKGARVGGAIFCSGQRLMTDGRQRSKRMPSHRAVVT